MNENKTYELKLISDSQGFLIGNKNNVNNLNNDLQEQKEQIKKLNTIDENVKQIRKILDAINPFSKTDIKNLVNTSKLQQKILKKQVLNLAINNNKNNNNKLATPRNKTINNSNNSNNNSNNNFNYNSNNDYQFRHQNLDSNRHNITNPIYSNNSQVNSNNISNNNANQNTTNNVNNPNNANNFSTISTPTTRQRDARGRFISNNTTNANENNTNKNNNGRDAKGRFLAKNKDGSDSANDAKKNGLLSKIAENVKNGFGELNAGNADELDPAIKATKEISAPLKFSAKILGGGAKIIGGGIKNLFSRGKNNNGSKENPTITQTNKSELNELNNNEKKRLNIFRKIADGINKSKENTKKFYKSLLKRLGNIEEDTERIGKNKKSNWLWSLLKFLPGLLITAVTGIFTKMLPFLISKLGGGLSRLLLRTLLGSILRGLFSLIGGVLIGSLKGIFKGIGKIFGFGRNSPDINAPNNQNNRNNNRNSRGNTANRGVNIPDVNAPNSQNGRNPNTPNGANSRATTRATSRIGRVVNFLKGVKVPVIGTALALLATGLAYADTENSNLSRRDKDKMHGENLGGFAGGGLGAWGGGVAGAALGTMILPGIGTAIGGLIGAIAGFFGGNSIGEWFGGFAGEWFNDLRNADIAGFIKAKWDAFCNFCQTGWTSAVDFFQSSWKNVSEFFKTHFGEFSKKLDAVIAWFNENFGGLFSKISGVFDAVIDWLKKLPGVGKAIEKAQEVKQTIQENYVEPTKNFVVKNYNATKEWGTEKLEQGTQFVENLVGGNRVGGKKLVDRAKNLADGNDKKTPPPTTAKTTEKPTATKQSGGELKNDLSSVKVDAMTEAAPLVSDFDKNSLNFDPNKVNIQSEFTKKGQIQPRRNSFIFRNGYEGKYTSEELEVAKQIKQNKTSIGIGKKMPEEVKQKIIAASQKYGVPVEHMLAMAAYESGGNQYAVSPTGCTGLYQFSKDTANQYGMTNRFDIDQQIEAQAKKYKVEAKALKNAGLPITLENMYMMHNQGTGFTPYLKKATTFDQLPGHKTIKKNGKVGYTDIKGNVYVNSWHSSGVKDTKQFAHFHGKNVGNTAIKKVPGFFAPVQVAKANKPNKKVQNQVASNKVQNVNVMQTSNNNNLATINKTQTAMSPNAINVQKIKTPETINTQNPKSNNQNQRIAMQNFSTDNIGQNLSDYRLAHVATGGIGGFVA